MRSLPILLLAALTLAGCDKPQTAANSAPAKAGAAQIENTNRGAMQDRTSSSPAEALYVEKCGMCHRQMGMGTLLIARRMDPKLAMLEDRTDLTVDFVTQVARTGVGNMPRMQRGEVSDAQLATIAGYLAKAKP
jgi:mono/diheme cytochrome c family protein